MGTYEIRVFAALGENPTFVADLNAAPFSTQPGFFRQVITGDVFAPGVTQIWEFDTRVGDEISLDVLNMVGANQQLSFTLKDPTGRTISNSRAFAESFNDADFGPFIAKADGTYTLTVDGVGDDMAAYQFLVSGPRHPV